MTLKLTSKQIDLLKSIHNGKRSYSADDTDYTLEDFQTIAVDLSILESFFLIEFQYPPHRESRTGNNYVDHVQIARLTTSGEELSKS